MSSRRSVVKCLSFKYHWDWDIPPVKDSGKPFICSSCIAVLTSTSYWIDDEVLNGPCIQLIFPICSLPVPMSICGFVNCTLYYAQILGRSRADQLFTSGRASQCPLLCLKEWTEMIIPMIIGRELQEIEGLSEDSFSGIWEILNIFQMREHSTVLQCIGSDCPTRYWISQRY